MQKAIPYYRVSTSRQGFSGLGLEAQQKAVHDYAAAFQLQLLNEFVEIESGRKCKRIVLAQALHECRMQKGILLIAKLDRLGRNVAFISQLMEAKIDFRAVDNPTANRLVLHIMAAFAEYEREQISQRTKDALQAAKRRGKVLGEYGRNVLSKINKDNADSFAIKMSPVFDELKSNGFKTVRSLTRELNRRKIEPFSGRSAKWHIFTVYSIIKRMEKLRTKNT